MSDSPDDNSERSYSSQYKYDNLLYKEKELFSRFLEVVVDSDYIEIYNVFKKNGYSFSLGSKEELDQAVFNLIAGSFERSRAIKISRNRIGEEVTVRLDFSGALQAVKYLVALSHLPDGENDDISNNMRTEDPEYGC